MKIQLVVACVLLTVLASLLACGGDKPPMVPDQDQTAQPDAGAD